MRKYIFALLLALLPAAALAQSSPGLYTGQVPTAAQWNSYFAAKQDALGYTPLNRAGDAMLGRLTLTPSTLSSSGFNMNVGVAPTTPKSGDVWMTTLGVYFNLNGVTYGPVLVPGAAASFSTLALSGTTDSTSPSTGALTVAGGAGVGKNLNVGGTTASTSSSTGAAVVAGGAGIGGALNVGGSLGVAGTGQFGTTSAPGSMILDGSASGTGGGWFTSIRNGGVGLLYFGNKSAILGGAYDATPYLYSPSTIHVGPALAVDSTTASTSPSTGSFTTGGGLGVLGAGYFGGSVFVGGNVVAGRAASLYGIIQGHSGTNQNFAVTGPTDLGSGISIDSINDAAGAFQPMEFRASQYYFKSGGALNVADTTASTSTGTGSLTTAGGLGVAGAGWFGGNVHAPASGYYNFGATDGTSGYGIRDNAGVLQAKNSGGAWANISTSAALPTFSGRLVWTSTTQVTYTPYNGETIRIAGSTYSVPSAGVTTGCTNATLAANTKYYVYIWNNTGTLNCEISATGHSTDTTAGNVGTEIKTGDNSRSLVGMVQTDGTSLFQDNARFRYVASWFNRKMDTAASTDNTDQSTTSATYVTLSSTAEIVAWAGEALLGGANATGVSAGGTQFVGLAFDGALTATAEQAISLSAGNFLPVSVVANTIATDGLHYVRILGKTTTGTFTIKGATAVTSEFISTRH